MTVPLAIAVLVLMPLAALGLYAFYRTITGARDRTEILLGTLQALRATSSNETTPFERSLDTDPLTGLVGHTRFQERLAQEVDRAKRYGLPLSLVLVDVDRFRDVNDALGHAEGDRVIKHVAAIIRQSTRETDVAARIGGEEFAALLPMTTREHGRMMAERIRAQVEASPAPLRGKNLNVTVSCGIAGFAGESDITRTKLFAHAEQAVSRAKSDGRNRTAE